MLEVLDNFLMCSISVMLLILVLIMTLGMIACSVSMIANVMQDFRGK